jgi:signal transduction histidine kinase
VLGLAALAASLCLLGETWQAMAIDLGGVALVTLIVLSAKPGTPRSLGAERLAREDRRLALELAPKPAPEVVELPPDTLETAIGKRHRETYIAAVSHELRTPLNAILGFTEVLLGGIDGPLSASQQEDVTAIHDAGTHLKALVEEVIGESAGQASAREIGPIEIEPLVRELGRGLEAQLRARPVTLRISVDADLPSPNGDARRLRQILWNLGTNAIRYTERGEITLRVAREGDQLRFSVRDTGRGIAEEDLGRIFAAGERVERAGVGPVRARPNEGWGLGLAIAQEMAEFHGGVIAYATDFDDVGVVLPRCFKGKKGTVWAELAQDDAIVWHCPRCHTEGRISNWQGTLWDLSDRPDTAS